MDQVKHPSVVGEETNRTNEESKALAESSRGAETNLGDCKIKEW